MEVLAHQLQIEAAMAARRAAQAAVVDAAEAEAKAAWEVFLAREAAAAAALASAKQRLRDAEVQTKEAGARLDAAVARLDAVRYQYRAEHEDGFTRRHPTFTSYRRAIAALEAASR